MIAAKTSWRFEAATAAVHGTLTIDSSFKITADIVSLAVRVRQNSGHATNAVVGQRTSQGQMLGKLVRKRKSKSMPVGNRYEVLFQ